MPDHHGLPFVFSGPELDRLAPQRQDETWLAAQLDDSATRFVPVSGDNNVLLADGVTPLLLNVETAKPLLAKVQCTVLMGNYRGATCFALGLPADVTLPVNDAVLTNLRPQFGVLDHGALALLGYARAMVHWHTQNRFCGKCGAPAESHRAGHELHCPRCGNVLYPRVNPAIIVLVTHKNRCLLGRQSPGNRFSTLAGFVEPGENLEATVRREVREETNIRVGAMHYMTSQPWPYPASLMLGFQAAAENTDIHCNDGELIEARWFSRADIIEGLRNNSLTLPTPQSISYWLLRTWFEETREFSLASFNPLDIGGARS
ncbi:MAG: NAD(+) diphosphatase [Gammaproteobacteria bacterium]